ncbi:MAG TPA: methyltransferase domain-containing protein [Candidatus Dormibacteraeota bacterium]|nr:methyltransferase domain-containing protein [Candidatus Dormibacteraeota bacterium]
MTVAAPRIRRLFDRFAHVYDTAALQRAVYRPAHDAVVAELRTAAPMWVLDAGCGTGILADRIGDDVGPARVVGCDLSMGMLRRAAERCPRGAWLQGDALRLPLRDAVVDAVVTTQAFHFLTDRRGALAEFHRVLRTGGLLVIAMVNPRTAIASRVMSGAGTHLLGAGVWPTRDQLRDDIAACGFDLREQRGVGPLSHTVVSVATARRLHTGRTRLRHMEG